ncbi:MAG: pentapeptide repeat-containing protein [Gammaproteobacteria bacterium]
MSGTPSVSAITIFVLLVFVAIGVAGLIWLMFPGWLRKKYGAGIDAGALAVEDGYRKALSQVLGFPIAVFGAVGAYLTVASALEAYGKAVSADFQERYRRGFDMLPSKEAATRIGGLYVLENLLKLPQESGIDKQARNFQIQRNMILQSIAAFAVDHSHTARPDDDPVVTQDALLALRIIGEVNLNVREFPVTLRGGYFVGSYAPGVNFEHVDLYGTNFGGSDFYDGKFYEANLRGANFNGSNLTLADFSHAGFWLTTFCPAPNYATAELMGKRTTESRMAEAKFYDATGADVYFDNAYLPQAIFNNSVLKGAGFTNADLYKAAFLGVTLESADFTGANLAQSQFGADRGDASLTDVTFDRALLTLADFRQAKLTNARFRNADLRGASFSGATLEGVDFSDADLTDARFDGASLSGMRFRGAILKNTSFAKTQLAPQALVDAIHCDEMKPADGIACSAPRSFELRHGPPAPHCNSPVAAQLPRKDPGSSITGTADSSVTGSD